MTKKIKINLDDAETRAIWNSALEARREIASWPAWKRRAVGAEVEEEEENTMRVFNDSDMADAERLFERIKFLSTNGPYHPGVTRPAYSTIETAALRELETFAHKSDLRVWQDTAANVWFEQPDVTPDPAIWIGSHIDSVPQGGNYDGLAGIIAGLLCLRKIRQGGLRTPRQIRAIALRGEESAWFGVPYIGAKAFLGKLDQRDLERPLLVNGRPSGEPLSEHMKNCGAVMDRIMRGIPCIEPHRVAEYWELHIEQGPVLVKDKYPVGIVTSIRGNVRHANVQIVGLEGHSGTVPRELRNDAVFAFADLITALDAKWAQVLTHGEDLVVTCGIVETDATVHGITRIPGNVRFCLEWRSKQGDVLRSFRSMVRRTCDEIAAKRGVQFVFDDEVRTQPALLSKTLTIRTSMACAALRLASHWMPSGAGHDAAVFSNAGVPTGMIFVRNENGSHNPQEAMDMHDFMDGVEVLYKAVTSES